MKKEETNDIVQFLLPELEKLGIPRPQCKVDVSVETTGRRRGDVWISRVKEGSKFESNIVGLVEAKHRNCELGDMDWRDAMDHGRAKSSQQALSFYIVSNCRSTHRIYSRFTDEEVTIDGKVATALQSVEVLEKIQAQVNPDNAHVVHKTLKTVVPVSESKFRRALHSLADIYRSCGLKSGDERIDPTVGFVVLKYIGEKESARRTLNKVVKVWDEYGAQKGNFKADFDESRKDIFDGEYGNIYLDFKELVRFSEKLKNDHYKQIHVVVSEFHFHGCSFDVFGAIYEEFASQTKKKEFGEFYTRRHITGIVARLLLRKEITPRDMKLCDPACGTGGFLTEAYKALVGNYAANGKWNAAAKRRLQNEVFWGYDNDERSVSRAQLNMFLVGDGHNHIRHIQDSLAAWRNGWKENEFDYILTNPPMGAYDGEAKVENFSFTNEKRYEMLFLERIIAATKPGGEIAVIVPDGLLEAITRENCRKKLLDACDIYATIALTRFAFAPYTKEKTYVLLIRKKQEEEIGDRQKFPIWHFIVDFDGFANNDKRFRTKYHDDLPEMEAKFEPALALAKQYVTDRPYFDAKRGEYERAVNSTERSEGFSGLKCGFVEIERVNQGNFHNLLSEFYLRPHETPVITESDFDKRARSISESLLRIVGEMQK